MRENKRFELKDARSAAMETTRNRLMVVIVMFGAAFLFLGVRTLDLGLVENIVEANNRDRAFEPVLPARADIIDRNGVILATNLETASLYANPRQIQEPEVAARQLVRVLPELSEADVLAKFRSNRHFTWLRRKLTPRQQWQVNALGIPGLGFQMEEERVYPQGDLAAHVLGFVDVDGNGIAGVENFFDTRLSDPMAANQPLRLSIDVRVQHAITDELARTVARFSAAGAAGMVMDVNTGEVLAMVSLPDFDPNHANNIADTALFNRVSKGVYELGSIFKTFTMAMALDAGIINLSDSFDARQPIRIARFEISDDHPQNRILTVPEIFTYSSNIGAARIALDVGAELQQDFLSKISLLRPATIELPEVGRPIYPDRWREITTMTVAYGHGIAVSPLQVAGGISAMVNGGIHIPATLVANDAASRPNGTRVISSLTSDQIRGLMRVAVTTGTGRNADVPGYRVGGKTGTAEKPTSGGYQEDALISSFVGVFPMDAPRYLVLVSVDEPHGTRETFNFATAGWVAAPTVRNVIARIAPILGVEPRLEDDERYMQINLLVAEE
jgi:cell division protein FtsI (penicillin-binding protein 3)